MPKGRSLQRPREGQSTSERAKGLGDEEGPEVAPQSPTSHHFSRQNKLGNIQDSRCGGK